MDHETEVRSWAQLTGLNVTAVRRSENTDQPPCLIDGQAVEYGDRIELQIDGKWPEKTGVYTVTSGSTKLAITEKTGDE
jgi:hypothetical protein